MAVAFIAAVSLAGATTANASVTIGQLSPGNNELGCSANTDWMQGLSTSGPNIYEVPALPPAQSLVISSWSHNADASANQRLALKIFRPDADFTNYTVVGHDGPRQLQTGSLNTFSGLAIPVEPGDFLGLHSPTSAGACGFSVDNFDTILSRTGDAPDGATVTFPGATFSRRLNLTAVVEPSNAFEIRDVKRNKRKGTAALKLDLPNPGEVSVSGRGLKPKSAAPNDPGEVTLKLKPRGKAKRTLAMTGKAKVRPRLVYAPAGGEARTKTKRIKLVKQL